MNIASARARPKVITLTDAAADRVKEIMEKAALPAIEISVPLTVDCGVGDNWDEAH